MTSVYDKTWAAVFTAKEVKKSDGLNVRLDFKREKKLSCTPFGCPSNEAEFGSGRTLRECRDISGLRGRRLQHLRIGAEGRSVG